MKRIKESSKAELDTIVKIELTINELLNIFAAVANTAPKEASERIILQFHLPHHIANTLVGDASNPNLCRILCECKDILCEFGYEYDF